jgi:phosphopantothenoylcysteine decarboxylase/phosphopantothenate--cysteine ligase
VFHGRELLIGVTGGVAAFKTAALVSQLVQAGAGVTVVTTAAAERFVGAATFAALTGRPVAREVFDEAAHPLGAHIDLAAKAELLCVAPATANFLAKAACGLADDLLSTLYLAFPGPVLVAPAMNNAMWEKAAVQRNVAQLRADGVRIIDPEEGWLSCRVKGVGRMANPDRIFAAIQETLRHE